MFLDDLKDFNLPSVELKVLERWKRDKIFEKSLESRKKGKKFVFFEGPPTANGQPGIHHVLARAFKDVILRYKTMRGYYAPRRAGWDTHGLPVEIRVEKELGLKSKKEIEKFGVAEFNKKCRESVWRFKDEWEKLTERMGYWLDIGNPYVTYEKNYIETLWWIIAQFWKKKLLYKGHRVAPWCPRCGTALSSHEMAQGYKTVTDEAVTVKFQILNSKSQISAKLKIPISKLDKPLYILSWTTTPWTLPGNVALAVGEKIDYAVLESKTSLKRGVEGGEMIMEPGFYVLAKDRVGDLVKEGSYFSSQVAEVKGNDLVGLEYKPLFEVAPLKSKKSYRVYPADFVTTTDGTGVVHTAVMYGEDDYRLGTDLGLSKFHTVDEQGKFTKDVKGFAGLFVKSKETEKKIFEYLNKNGNFLKTEKYEHEYPHCWRCSTPLLYYARESWFVAMAKLKRQLVANNNTVNWMPEHIKNGRFGEWLRDVKDWNFSRERYWGTPLPIWECKGCSNVEVLESLNELSERVGGAKNEYFLMRHGESETQLLQVSDSGQGKFHLTAKGRGQVGRTAALLKNEGIDLIFASPVLRTRETAEIVSRALGLKNTSFDARIKEIDVGVFSGKPVYEYHKFLPTFEDKFERAPEGGESLREMGVRLWDFISEVERKHKNKKILIISHEYTIWILSQVMRGRSQKEAIQEKVDRGRNFIEVSKIEKTPFRVMSRDETGEVNLHRPYIDEIKLSCRKCGGEMKRVKGLCDVWFDSGAMPFAQVHWPFIKTSDKKQITDNRSLEYPADYIAEAVDQTRGWFYTLLAVATALGLEPPYKNVICLGHINDKNGQKMSKSKGNVIDPWVMADKYGIDAVRWYMYSATPPGEPKNFDEQEVLRTYRRVHLLVLNSLVFLNTYRAKGSSAIKKINSKNILDRWVMARLEGAKVSVTKSMDDYKVREAVLEIEKLVDDLSRWYIRRSRRRFQKPRDREDHRSASFTLGFLLSEIGKLMAPFSPFFSEFVYGVLGGKSSVHLEEWPQSQKGKYGTRNKGEEVKVIRQMEEVRRLAALGLAKRAEVGLRVKQPLSEMRIKKNELRIKDKQLLEILAEEVNVKNVVYGEKIANEVELDTNITAELREEWVLRELTRAVQDLRQKGGLRSGDVVVLMFEMSEGLRGIVQRNEDFIKKEVGAKEIKYQRSDKVGAESEVKIEDEKIWLGLWRV